MPDGFISPWLQAILLPSRFSVCGIIVRPISVWHHYALADTGNAYLVGGACDLNSAASLLMLCRLDHRDGRLLYLDSRRRARSLRGIHRDVGRIPWPALDAAVNDYVLCCTRVADRRRPTGESAGKPLAAPIERHVLLCLCAQYGMAEGEAWDHPWVEARCKYDVWRETQGDDLLADERLQRRIDEVAEQKARAS